MQSFKCKMFIIELHNFLLVTVTDRIIPKEIYIHTTIHKINRTSKYDI